MVLQEHRESGEQRLRALMEPLVSDLGYELVHLELESGGSLLRVYIEHRAANGGEPREITLADCEMVSHEVEALLDVEDPIRGRYRLEISSPGVARPLVKAEHFIRFRGHRARVTMDVKVEGQRRFVGIIEAVEDEKLLLNVEGEVSVRLPLAGIRKARLAPEFDGARLREK